MAPEPAATLCHQVKYHRKGTLKETEHEGLGYDSRSAARLLARTVVATVSLNLRILLANSATSSVATRKTGSNGFLPRQKCLLFRGLALPRRIRQQYPFDF